MRRDGARLACPSSTGCRIQAQDVAQSWVWSLLTGTVTPAWPGCAGGSFSPSTQLSLPTASETRPRTWLQTRNAAGFVQLLGPRDHHGHICGSVGRASAEPRAPTTHPPLDMGSQHPPWPHPRATAMLQSLPNHMAAAPALDKAGLQQPVLHSPGVPQQLPLSKDRSRVQHPLRVQRCLRAGGTNFSPQPLLTYLMK